MGKESYEKILNVIANHRLQSMLKKRLSKIYPLRLMEIRELKLLGKGKAPVKEEPKPVEEKPEEPAEAETPKKEEKTEEPAGKEDRPGEAMKAGEVAAASEQAETVMPAVSTPAEEAKTADDKPATRKTAKKKEVTKKTASKKTAAKKTAQPTAKADGEPDATKKDKTDTRAHGKEKKRQQYRL